jgi:uncharacterized protein (TIGR02147 family)
LPNISEYTDYRAFLSDFYDETKAKNPGFSYQTFSDRAGLASKGFLFNVIKGRRSLSKSNIFGLSKAMKLSKNETDYFENLVAFNLAKSLEERNHFYERLSSIKISGKAAARPQIVRKEQFEFYSRVHHSVIRSLIDVHGFTDDYERLAKTVRPRITAKQARASVELLEKLGFIARRNDGSYKVVDKSIATPPEVVNLAVQIFHREAGELALRALNDLPREARNISGVTLGISRETYRKICDEIQQFRAKLVHIAEADASADAVYHLNVQFFPVSQDRARKE